MKDESEKQFCFWHIKKSKKNIFLSLEKKMSVKKNTQNLIELKDNYRENSCAAVT